MKQHIDKHFIATEAIVSLLCLNKAKKGGESLLVSSMTIFNEILENYPDYLPTLFEPFPLDRRGEEVVIKKVTQ